MGIGRNDPCHCGSGKKYKKCCLAKDEEQARKDARSPFALARSSETDREEKPKPPPDPRREAWNARYDEFESAGYEDRIAIFNRTLDDGDLMNGEMAFEMLNPLFGQAVERNERDRFDALASSLGQRLPEVYAKEEKYVIEWRVINALELGRHEAISSFTNDLGRLPGLDIDKWNRVEARLAYHNHLPTLVEAMRLAWPRVRKSTEIVPWGIEEFSFRAVQYEIMNYLAQTPAPRADDPVLRERVEHYYGARYSQERIAHLIAVLSGQADRPWTLDDFKLPSREEEAEHDRDDDDDQVYGDDDWDEEALDDEEEDEDPDEDEWEDQDEEEGGDEVGGELDGEDGDEEVERKEKPPHPALANLYDLLFQFVRYAHRQEGTPYPKAEMARRQLLNFIRNRRRGDLKYQESMLDAMLRSEGLNRKPLKKYKPYKHELVPDRERFDHHLSDLFSMWGQQPHMAGALLELTPAWLRFLQLQGLVDNEMRRQALRELESLAGELLKIYKNSYNDRALCDAMERWKWDAGKDPVEGGG